VPTQDLRILTINLKHTLLMDTDEEDGDILVLPNTTMLSPLYIKNAQKRLQEKEEMSSSLNIPLGKTTRANQSTVQVTTAPRHRNSRGLIL